jgi:hypothetical protein
VTKTLTTQNVWTHVVTYASRWLEMIICISGILFPGDILIQKSISVDNGSTAS